MAGAGSEAHRERARRAQGLSDHALEQAAGERAAAQRSERLVADDADPALADIHRQSAALHRRAQEHYEEAADLQQLHAEHELRGAEQAHGREGSAPDPSLRDTAADRRDTTADERERLADVRAEAADAREHVANRREELQDMRERRFDEATGRWTPHEREQLARAKATLRRLEARLARQAEGLDRADARASSDQATIQRESTATDQDRRPPTSPPDNGPSKETG